MPVKYFGDLGKAVNDLFKDNQKNQVTVKGSAENIKVKTVLSYPPFGKKKNTTTLTFDKLNLPGVKKIEIVADTEKGENVCPFTAVVNVDTFYDSLSIQNDTYDAPDGNDENGEKKTKKVANCIVKAKHTFSSNGVDAAIDVSVASQKSLGASAVFGNSVIAVGVPFKFDLANKSSDVMSVFKGALSSFKIEHNFKDQIISTHDFNFSTSAYTASVLLKAGDDFDFGLKFENQGALGKDKGKKVSFATAIKIDDATKCSFQGASDGSLSSHLTHKLASPNLSLGFNTKHKFSKLAGFPAGLKATAFSMDFTFGN